MRRFTFLPWDIYSWKTAFAWSGTSGKALLALLLAEFLQLQDTNAPGAHASSATIWLIRGPFTFAAALLLLSQPSFPRLTVRDLRLWFLVYVGYFTLSLAWSTAPLQTAGKAFELLVGTLIVLQASRGENALRRLEGLYRLALLLFSLMALITVLGFFARIESFTAHRVGIFTQTIAESPFYSANGLGYMATAFLLVAFAEYLLGGANIAKALPQLSYALFIFIFAGSRTAFAILALGVVAVLLRRSKGMLIVFLLGAGSAGFFLAPRLIKRLNNGESQGGIDTLSGRTVMWLAAWRDWEKHPLLGYGGGVGGKHAISSIWGGSLSRISHLHDGFLECLTGLGIFGFLLACLILIVLTFRVARQWKRYPSFAGLYIWIIMIWVMNTMSIGIMSWMNSEVVIYLILLAHVDIIRRGAPGVADPPMRPALMYNVAME
jgi:O-antigen ligase